MLFLVDILVIFNSAFYNDDFELIESRPKIAKNYLRGWFTVDVLSIIPFDIIFRAGDFSSMARVARVGRLYKLAKLTKLFRVFKMMKQQSKLMRYLNELLKIGIGFERLIFFGIIFFLLCHISACLWIIIAAL